ncbi:hypothetical protein EVAR_17141_1 [Eumeta japonica]|uniref:Uncharacterized protein n=1 Tax=Eumeta variegata TaxID=151549 RepID=A0A4C1UM95_EUMVA|nr:hypothetical protein EVAR_17141_1 [Eumeta japonica]
MSSASTPSLKSVPFFVGEFYRARKPAPLNRFLVHSQSSYDEQRQYAKSQVCTALRRRVPPCTEISAAEPFSRPRLSHIWQMICYVVRGAAERCGAGRVAGPGRHVPQSDVIRKLCTNYMNIGCSLPENLYFSFTPPRRHVKR